MKQCEICKELIPLERIKAIPEIQLCVRCSQLVSEEYVDAGMNISRPMHHKFKKEVYE